MPIMIKKGSFKRTAAGFEYHPGDVLSQEDEKKHGSRLVKLGVAKEVRVEDVKEVYSDVDAEKPAQDEPKKKQKAKASSRFEVTEE